MTTGYCMGCGRRFYEGDLQEVKWENPRGITEHITDSFCEECIGKMCDSVGLGYEEPEEIPEPVSGQEVCRGGRA